MKLGKDKNPVSLRVDIDDNAFFVDDDPTAPETGVTTLQTVMPDFLEAVMVTLHNLMRLARRPNTCALAGVLAVRAINALNQANVEVSEMQVEVQNGLAYALGISEEELADLEEKAKEVRSTISFRDFVNTLDMTGIDEDDLTEA